MKGPNCSYGPTSLEYFNISNEPPPVNAEVPAVVKAVPKVSPGVITSSNPPPAYHAA